MGAARRQAPFLGRRVSRALLFLSMPAIRRVAPWALALASAATVALGLAGWRSYSGDVGDGDWPTVVYRTLALFLVDSSGAGAVPWQLAVARFLAVLVFASSTLAIVVGVTQGWAERTAARTARNHRIVIGPPDRARHHLTGQTDGGRAAVVHVVDDALQVAQCDQAHLHVVRSIDWLDAAAVASCRSVVVATGDDGLNLQLLGDVTELALATCERDSAPCVQVEIDDEVAGTWLAIESAVERCTVPIDVLLPSRSRAEMLALELVPPHRSEPTDTHWAVIGSSGRMDPAVRALVPALSDLAARTDLVQTPVLHLVAPPGSEWQQFLDDPAATAAPEPRTWVERYNSVRLVAHPDVDSLLCWRTLGPRTELRVAAVGHLADDLGTVMELVGRRPPGTATAWLGSGEGPVTLPSLQTLPPAGPGEPRAAWAAATARWRQLATAGADRSEGDPGATETTVPGIVALQDAAATLVLEYGYRLEPAASALGCDILPGPVARAIVARGGLGDVPAATVARSLPDSLAHGGIALVEPAADRTGAGSGP